MTTILGSQWKMRLERAEYEAALAERRYEEVDPAQRLVAATLERRWNTALQQLEELRKQAAEFQQRHARVATPEQKAKVLALAKDLPKLWHAPTTQSKDRKTDTASSHPGYHGREGLCPQTASCPHPLAG